MRSTPSQYPGHPSDGTKLGERAAGKGKIEVLFASCLLCNVVRQCQLGQVGRCGLRYMQWFRSGNYLPIVATCQVHILMHYPYALSWDPNSLLGSADIAPVVLQICLDRELHQKRLFVGL